MAGSRKDVNYVSDDGNTFAISVDESNIELVMGGSVPLTSSGNRKPSNLKSLRTVVLTDITGTIRRKIPVLTQARYNQLVGTLSFTLPAGDIDEGTNVVVAERIPEKYVRLPKIFDTGKNDGDAS